MSSSSQGPELHIHRLVILKRASRPMNARYQPPGSTSDIEHFEHTLHRSASHRFLILLRLRKLLHVYAHFRIFDDIGRGQLCGQQHARVANPFCSPFVSHLGFAQHVCDQCGMESISTCVASSCPFFWRLGWV